jgi:pyruvate kinase
MQSQAGPELRGCNIDLDKITNKTDVSKRQTKIVCTMGPSCWEIPQLEALIDAGMSVARFNFSHGDQAVHKATLDRLRQAAANKGVHVGTFVSFQSYIYNTTTLKSIF